MKTFNYILSLIFMIISPFQMFVWAENDLQFAFGFILMIASIIFFLFALIEERNKEISELRETLYKYKKHFMID
jgi:hypothetical protein